MALENAKKSMDMLAKDETLNARVENISQGTNTDPRRA